MQVAATEERNGQLQKQIPGGNDRKKGKGKSNDF